MRGTAERWWQSQLAGALKLFLLLFTFHCAIFASRGEEFTVFAAASLMDSLTEIGRDFEKFSGHKASFNFSASSILARQIAEGAPADIFLSADEEKMDWLEKRNLLKRETRRALLSNILVVVLEAGSKIEVQSPSDLLKLKRLAVAEPSTVPAGIYARRYLENGGVWKSLQSKIIPTENVRAALAAVESGNAEGGIVFKTDAALSKKVRIAFEFPSDQRPAITYAVAAMAQSKRPKPGEAFLKYLVSESALKVFKKHGFIVLKP